MANKESFPESKLGDGQIAVVTTVSGRRLIKKGVLALVIVRDMGVKTFFFDTPEKEDWVVSYTPLSRPIRSSSEISKK